METSGNLGESEATQAIGKIGATRRSRTGDLLITNCPEGHTDKEPEGKDS